MMSCINYAVDHNNRLCFRFNLMCTTIATLVQIRLFSIEECNWKLDRFKKLNQSFLQWLVGVSKGIIADDCECFGSTRKKKNE